MSNDDIYKLALDYWGYDAQVDMCVEECSELIKALCKHKRNKDMLKEGQLILNIAEEIADVEIMLDQMKLLFGVEGQVHIEKDYKLSRLTELLNKKE